MPRIIAVIRALRPLGESGNPPSLAQSKEALSAPGEKFVHIALVPDVKNDLILGKLKYAVQPHRELHDPKVGREMPAAHGNRLKDLLPQLLAIFL